MPEQPAMPECERMVKVAPDSQKIGEFLEWLGEQGIQLCTWHDKSEEFRVSYMSIEKRLAAYFNIDLNKVEDERRALLEYIRSNNG